jgi:hypothetical protein
MSKTLAMFFRGATFAAIAAFSWTSVMGQGGSPAIKIKADDPSYMELYSPELGTAKGKSFKPKEWLEIETKINVEMAPEPKSKTCDSLTIKWYLMVENPDKAGSLLLITRDIEYVNIPLKEDVYCSAYLSPGSNRRILGDARNVTKVVKYVGFEIIYNGQQQPAAVGTNKEIKGRKDFWNIASESVSRTEAVTLMDKSETPFAHMWWDRYAEVRVKKD